MIRISRRLFLVAVCALALTSCGNGGSSTAQESYISGNGAITFISAADREMAPKLSGDTLYGTKFDFTDKKIAVVNVWASWCTTCRKEHEMIMNIAKNTDLQLIGVNYKDTKVDGEKYLEVMGNPFDLIIFDPNGKIGMDLGVYATPETFLVNQDGLILYKHIGEIDSGVWEDNFAIHLNKSES